jgi:hypothetical protein
MEKALCITENITNKKTVLNMDDVIVDLMERYSMTRVEVEKAISPEYDIKQRGENKKETVIVRGYEVLGVDEKLVNLYKLINKYDFCTCGAYQHNMFGWASFIFHADGYKRFMNTLIEKAREKGYDNEKIYELNIYKKLEFSLSSNYPSKYSKNISVFGMLPSGKNNFLIEINFTFLQSEIPIIENELNELFDGVDS